MHDRQKQKHPGGGRGEVAKLTALCAQHRTTGKPWEGPKLPKDWRDRLPDSKDYYRARVPKRGKANATGWAQGPCPFHEDRNASLSVNVRAHNGGWRCFAGCGKGDLVAFHGRITGKAFDHAVADLLGVRA